MTTTAAELPDPPLGGWRDEPVEDDPCPSCEGWGAKDRWVRVAAPKTRDGHRLEYRGQETCGRCSGTGRRRPI